MKYEHIISPTNLLAAWREFINGKRNKKDVQEFQSHLMDNLFSLHSDLKEGTYKHSPYYAFKVSDPKPRDIHKASVRDRLLHHAIYRQLYPVFDRTWVHDSYSCRNLKGTHRALKRFKAFAYKVSKNNTRTCWILKCDIRKFFASIDQEILLCVVNKHISDTKIQNLIKEIVQSFESTGPGKGLPLGNLTSQLLVNVYMNEFDQFVKHVFKAKYYIRYADDFVVLSGSRQELEALLVEVKAFLKEHLLLELHPHKVSITTLNSGIDFLGWVNFPTHKVLRTSTKNRMVRNLSIGSKEARLQSYRGLLKHGNAYKLCTQHLG